MINNKIKYFRSFYRTSLAVGYLYACLVGMIIGALITPGAINTEAHSEISNVVATVEPIEVVEIVEPVALLEAPQVVEEEPDLPLTDEEIDLIALVTMAEAEGESEQGKRLVISTILNRVDDKRFPNTVSGVIYQPYAFEVMRNGRIDKCYVTESIRELVISELHNRSNSEVIYFRTGYYSSYGTPLFKVGNHYFSSN